MSLRRMSTVKKKWFGGQRTREQKRGLAWLLLRNLVLMVLRVEHMVACKLACECKRKRGGKKGETGRQGDGERETERSQNFKKM